MGLHSQVLVIKPKEVNLDSVMYWYQEVDKDLEGRMNDERCQFYLNLKEEEIPSFLTDLKDKLESDKKKSYERIQYRLGHTLKEYEEEYGEKYYEHYPTMYNSKCDALLEYENIKDLPVNDKKQINFIKEYAWYSDKLCCEEYYMGVGYGTFYNPYELWDYYKIVDAFRFPTGTKFLKTKDDREGNIVMLDDLDVTATIENIKSLTYVFEHIILSNNDSSKSVLYTVDNIRFGTRDWNVDCLVEDLDTVLQNISDEFGGMGYDVTALDFHW